MKYRKNKNSGFTLIELVLVIALLGVLSAVAIPMIFNFSTATAEENAKKAVVGAINTGLSLYAANEVAEGRAPSYPAALDAAAIDAEASLDTPLFTGVLKSGVISGPWKKKSATCYHYGTTPEYFEYDDDEGTFMKVAADCVGG